MSYLVSTNELTLTDIRAYKTAAIEAGILRAIEKLGVGRGELVTREALPATDFPAAWATEYYVGPAIAAVGWGAASGGAATGTVPVGRVAVFYKLADADDNPAYTAVRFRLGAGGASTKASFFFQLNIDNKLESDCYFSEPIVYDPNDIVTIQAYSRVALHAAEELSFGCFIIEKVGATVS